MTKILNMSCFWTLLSVGKVIGMEKGLAGYLSRKNKMHLHNGHRNKLKLKRVLEEGKWVRLASLCFAFPFRVRYTS
jgi:hypothetical protein